MSFFVLADTQQDGSPLQNVRQGGYKNQTAAIHKASQFHNALVRMFDGKKFVNIYVKLKGEELITPENWKH